MNVGIITDIIDLKQKTGIPNYVRYLVQNLSEIEHIHSIHLVHYENCADDDFQYLAPEIINGESSGRSSDLYSLGIIIYESIFASLPFKAEDNKELLKKITHAPVDFDFNKISDIPGDMVLMVKKMLAKTPVERFVDASALEITVEAMHNFSKHSMKPEEPQKTRSITTSAFMAISLIVAVLLVLWVIIGQLLK